MNPQESSPVTAHSRRFWKIAFSLLGWFTGVVVSGQSIQFEWANGTVTSPMDIGRLEDIFVRRSMLGLGWRLAARGPDGKQYQILGLDQQSAERVQSEVVRLGVEKAKAVSLGLIELEGRLSANGYMRYGESRELHKEIVRHVSAVGLLVERNLEAAPFRAFNLLYRCAPRSA